MNNISESSSLRSLLAACLAVALCGCQPHSAKTVPSGHFQLAVDDMVNDESFRVITLKVSSMRPGNLSVDGAGTRAAGDLLISEPDKPWEARVIFIASRTIDSCKTNALIQVSLQVKIEGGDGRMLLQGSFQSGGSMVYPVSLDTKLNGFLGITATNGIYPLRTPLQIGQVNRKPVTLTITD